MHNHLILLIFIISLQPKMINANEIYYFAKLFSTPNMEENSAAMEIGFATRQNPYHREFID